jgi:serine/threonine-protein kinase
MTSRYRIQGEIGTGGMGRVNLASMEGPGGFQKWVAIKRLHAHLLRDENAVNMFVEEARIAASISHPNVATVFELGEDDGDYFIAMEYLHGEPLREIVRRLQQRGEIMPPQIACRILSDAAEGLHAAHDAGVVHRDATPHNLFVTYEGATKVVDFGVAKIRAAVGTTGAGELKGKLAYMAPEQITGGAVDRRTDVFALGVVAWELTTGQRLFRGKCDRDTMDKVLQCQVPRTTSFIDHIIMQALAPNPDDRFATARQFARAIQIVLMGRGELVTRDDVSAFLRRIMPDRIAARDSMVSGGCPRVEPNPAATLTDPTIVCGHAATCPMRMAC